MKLNPLFITRLIDEKQIMVSADEKLFSGIITSNATAAFIVDCLKQDTTVADIVEKMCQIYDAPREIIESDVSEIITKLKEINAIQN